MVREIIQRIQDLISNSFPVLYPPKIDEAAEYKKAQEFFSELIPEDDREKQFDLALDFAKEQYQESIRTFDLLDSKAERLFHFAVTFAGAIVGISKLLQIPLGGGLLVSFVLLCVVMILTMRIRNPTGRTCATQNEDLLRFSNECNLAYLKGKIAASLNSAMVGTRLVCNWKSNLLKCSNRIFILAIIVLAVGLVLAPDVNSSTSDTTTHSDESVGS